MGEWFTNGRPIDYGLNRQNATQYADLGAYWA